MYQKKLEAGSIFPKLFAKDIENKNTDISKPSNGADWKMIIVYRGKHCPLCTKYLNNLEKHVQKLRELGVDLVAISADRKSQLVDHLESLQVSFPVYYDLSIEQMQQLGLYISIPRSEKETDHPFAEPGLFIVNADGETQVIDISNGPFVRPELETLVSGISFIRNPDTYRPIRGTYK